MNHTRILIPGSGFGGMDAAMHLGRTLARDPNFEVAWINEDNFLLFDSGRVRFLMPDRMNRLWRTVRTPDDKWGFKAGAKRL
jgi:hypothetical protein